MPIRAPFGAYCATSVQRVNAENCVPESDVPRYKKGEDDGTTQFGMGLVLLDLGRVVEADRALLRGMAANRYVAPMLFGDRWTLLDGWHGTNLAEPEHADGVVSSTRDLWYRNPDHLDHLADLWHHPAVEAWRDQLDDSMVALRDARGAGPDRSALLTRYFALMREDEIERVQLAVMTGESGPLTRSASEEERFEVGNTYVIDMRHRDAPPDADLPRSGRPSRTRGKSSRLGPRGGGPTRWTRRSVADGSHATRPAPAISGCGWTRASSCGVARAAATMGEFRSGRACAGTSRLSAQERVHAG